jgi:hypothetical protein
MPGFRQPQRDRLSDPARRTCHKRNALAVAHRAPFMIMKPFTPFSGVQVFMITGG